MRAPLVDTVRRSRRARGCEALSTRIVLPLGVANSSQSPSRYAMVLPFATAPAAKGRPGHRQDVGCRGFAQGLFCRCGGKRGVARVSGWLGLPALLPLPSGERVGARGHGLEEGK